jgi:hypothetical protein
MRTAKISGLILIGLMASGWISASNGSEWRTKPIDPNGGGKYSTLRLDGVGNAHVCFIDDSQYQLKYGFWDHTLDKWFTMNLDTSSGFCSMILDSKQRPHIAYLDYGTGKLKYVRWNGSSWDKQTLQISAKEIAFYTSIALDLRENPIISFYEYWGTGYDYLLNLRVATWTGQFWEVKTVDSTPGSGKFNAIAADSAGMPHVAYANVVTENSGLRYASWNGKAWDIEVLEGAASPGAPTLPVFSVTLLLDKQDVPHISYTDVRSRLVKYATRRGGRWQLEVVDTIAREAYPDRNGIALDDQGRPYISYFDGGSGQLKIAARINGKWVAEIVDQNSAGLNSSLQIGFGGLWVTYADASGRSVIFSHRPLGTASVSQPVAVKVPSSSR